MSPVELYYGASDGWHSFIDDHLVVGSSPPTQRAFGDPGPGNLYMGQTNLDGSAGNNSAAHPTHYPRETYYTHKVGVSRDYSSISSTTSAVAKIGGDLAQGRIPWVSFKLGSTTWAQFASGAQDSWWSGFLSDVNAIGKGPVIVTLHHEPNPSTATGLTNVDYKNMYAHAYSMKTAYPQILLVPVLTGGYYEVSSQGLRFSDWMDPASCDGFGFDSYNHKSFSPNNGKRNLTIQQMFGLQAAQCRAMDPNKPWFVGEWGVRTDPANAGAAAQYMQDAFDYARNNGCYALGWFDSGTNVNDGGSPWFLDDTTDGTNGLERLNKMKSILSTNAHAVSIPAGGIPRP